jgi:hypothetical protein
MATAIEGKLETISVQKSVKITKAIENETYLSTKRNKKLTGKRLSYINLKDIIFEKFESEYAKAFISFTSFNLKYLLEKNTTKLILHSIRNIHLYEYI